LNFAPALGTTKFAKLSLYVTPKKRLWPHIVVPLKTDLSV